MDRQRMIERIRNDRGFVAALDQSGGSTPKTLVGYGLAPDAWSSEADMFELIHSMRCRILASPAFSADRILAAILFERTLEGSIEGVPVPRYLHDKGILPLLKVDQGLEDERNGVQLMKPLSELDRLLQSARKHRVLGTKMRAVIKSANPIGIAAVVRQQFELADHIADHGFLPILEPEYDIYARDRAEGEALLRERLMEELDRRPNAHPIMLKLSIPAQSNAYLPLVAHPRVAKVVALSGGFSRAEACRRLAMNKGMVASFSRALISDLRVTMSSNDFDAALASAIDEIYDASARACAWSR